MAPTTAPRLAPLLIVPGGLALVVGLDAGLSHAGVPVPVDSHRLAELHGPLMVLGFLGTVIALERAVALRRAWAMLAPALLGAGALLLALLPQPLLGRLLVVQGLLTLVLVYAALRRRNQDPLVDVQLVGAVLAAAAALLLTRVDVAVTLPLLIGFVVLTIGAERVELARLAMPADAPARLTALTLLLCAGVLAAVLWPGAGWSLLGGALLLLTAWLARHDVARRLVRSTGLPRFAAAALLLGYAWLALVAVVLLVGGRPGGAGYDIVVHGTFLGYAMSMVLAHAPVILPAVLRVRLPYRPVMWVPLVLLHASLLARVLTGAAGLTPGWQGALVANVVALLLFVVVSAAVAVLATRRARARHTPLSPHTPRTKEHR
ncbi:hypothetical protein [Ornithinimicrobium tianjinense]|uniref:NnrS protein n=1 Tax=Ornithinimicrobium tianjinense TaxID=1195761 RepID=A0A917BWV4_9MICO|nr:hypothetical protein [Ornithinimicrobium tianjinense]GGF60487.1 hypothetical protein GCM10011366_30430 [Ornithinimicrobium tianjinense]